MPINASPEYDKAEQKYRQAGDPAEQLELLQEMLRLIPKHKGSEKAQSEIKRKISTLKAKLESAGGKTSSTNDPYYVPRSGAGQIALIGQPNTGKSSVVAAVTEAKVKIEPYPYSTASPLPGMWKFEDLQFQLIDTPPISGTELPGEFASLLRRADITAVVADIASPDGPDQVLQTLDAISQRGITLLEEPKNTLTQPGSATGIIIVTHADTASVDDIEIFAEMLELENPLPIVPFSPDAPDTHLQLAGQVWRSLGKIKIYTREPGSREEPTDPFTLPIDSTVEDLALHIHRELAEKVKFARISGPNRQGNQQYHKTEVLQNCDLVELHV